MKNNKNILWFEEVGREDVNIVGGKGANLGEMYKANIPVPYGFVVTASGYFNFLRETGLDKAIKEALSSLNHQDPKSLQQTAANIRRLILSKKMSEDIAKDIMLSYLNLSGRASKHSRLTERLSSFLKLPLVAVRSSATAEDLPNASFAGQQDTYLNIKGEAVLVKKVQEAWASLFTPRAIFYREEQKFNHLKVGIAVVVQIMVDSKASGVMFTLDPVTNEKGKIVIEGIFGLGELIVQGAVTPDHYEVDKKTMQITVKNTAVQEKKLIKKDGENKEIKLSKGEGGKQKVSDKEIIEIANLGKKLEKHYFFPQDVEWALENGKVYIVQTRPVTTIKSETPASPAGGRNLKSEKEKNEQKINLKLLLKGDPASPGIASGKVKVIYSASEIAKILPGDVLVTVQTNPDFVPAMKRAVAIVTERGGRTSHAAIVSRELGIPAVVGCATATKLLKTGMMITVHGAKGEIYEGVLTKSQSMTLSESLNDSPGSRLKTATRVYVNLATPTRVDEVSKMNVDGIGLLRAEFMIADIGTHPKKLIKEHKENVFVNKLGSDLLKFCKAFNPRPVVYRATDFKTNEYRNLIGGKEFEPEEPDPMLGYRGA